MRPLLAIAMGLSVAVIAACGSDGDDTFVGILCPTVQAWSDRSVDEVNAFSRDSPDLTPAARRDRYAEAIVALGGELDELAARIGALSAPTEVLRRLADATTDMAANVEEVMADADALSESAYEFASVRDGHLFTGTEKNQAIIFQALSDLSDDGLVPRGCGRRGPLDLSPSATYPN